MSRVEFAQRLREHHHAAIWEEQKHFTWLISLVLSAEIVAIGSGRLAPGTRDWLTLAASLLGIVMTFIAIRIQRREGTYFTNANKVFVTEFNRLFPEHALDMPKDRDSSLRTQAAQLANGKANVRDHFELLYATFALVFVALAIYAGISRLS